MLTLSLFIIALFFLLMACFLVLREERLLKNVKNETIKRPDNRDGHEIVKRYIYASMRIGRREIESRKKLALQYMLHIWVRILSY